MRDLLRWVYREVPGWKVLLSACGSIGALAAAALWHSVAAALWLLGFLVGWVIICFRPRRPHHKGDDQ
jgi:hypothetical protein